MAQTVGQYQRATFTSPHNTPATDDALDADVVRSNDNLVRSSHNSHDADGGIHLQSSTLALRPAAGTLGRKWFTTDSPRRLWFDTGAAWVEVEYMPSGTTFGPDFYLFAIGN